MRGSSNGTVIDGGMIDEGGYSNFTVVVENTIVNTTKVVDQNNGSMIIGNKTVPKNSS